MSIRLSPQNQWDLFVGMVCRLLAEHKYNGNIYEMASCLDMTFEEVKRKPIWMWQEHIESELLEYKRSDGKYEFNSNFK